MKFDMLFPEITPFRDLSEVRQFAMKVDETQDAISGKIRQPVIGEVQMRPCDLRDDDLVNGDLTEQQRQ